MVTTIFFAVGALIALVVLAALVGATLPRNHQASRTVHFAHAPQDVWPVISEAMSKSQVPVDILESQPLHRLVTRVKETEKMFGGTWTVVIEPQPDGSSVTITEDGWVANPIFRFVSRFVIGHHATMDSVLKRVSQNLQSGVGSP